MTQKFNLKCVNKGKPFLMPNWTPKKHETALAKLDAAQKENKWGDKEADREFKYFVVHETLSEIDPTCELEQVRNLHPVTLIELFREVYQAGKENIYYQDFRKGRKTPNNKK